MPPVAVTESGVNTNLKNLYGRFPRSTDADAVAVGAIVRVAPDASLVIAYHRLESFDT